MPDNNVVRLPTIEPGGTGRPQEHQPSEQTVDLSPSVIFVDSRKQEFEAALKSRDEIQAQLENELRDAHLLHDISSMLVDESDVNTLYQKLVDVATDIMRSNFGSMQRYDPEKNALQLIAHHGLNDEAVAFWEWVQPGQATSCGQALAQEQRVTILNFDTCDFMQGTEDLGAFRKAGVLAAHSTPLRTRAGKLVGMITTHWTRPYEPSARDLLLLDIVARQAADVIERNIATEVLRQQAVQLIEADRYKNEFLATLAHELRNPLAPIRNGLEVLKIGKPEQGPRVLAMMERQLGRMVHLIDDLLDVSRISRGMITLRPARIALSSVIDSAVEASRPLISAANHHFTVTMPGNVVWMNVDVMRVVQIISNLLNNAAKYTLPGGHIALVAEVLDGQVIVRISDNGIGISAEMLPKIFTLFIQVDGAAEQSQGGLGVGLALSRKLAEMHGGGVVAASDGKGQGSSFSLRLPVLVTDALQVEPHDALECVADGAHTMRILIVDDNADAAETLAMVLEGLGHRTSVVIDSRKALQVAAEFAPNAVFLDIGMPHLNGFELARAFRMAPAMAPVKLIALSGWGTEEDREKGREAGMNYHLTKPVRLTDVVQILSKVEELNCA